MVWRKMKKPPAKEYAADGRKKRIGSRFTLKTMFAVISKNWSCLPESWRVGVLFGRHQVREGVPCLFISGALETRAADFENGRLRFTESTWKDIFRRKEEFFPDMGVCGWFVYEKSGGLVDKLSLKKTYEEAFAQGDKVLLLHDDDDQEAFYMLWKGGLDRMKGYYIYYERNEPMQAYMESERKIEPPREEGREAVVQQFRARMEEMRKSGGNEKRDRRDKRNFLASRGDEAGKPGPRLLSGKKASWLSPGKNEEPGRKHRRNQAGKSRSRRTSRVFCRRAAGNRFAWPRPAWQFFWLA